MKPNLQILKLTIIFLLLISSSTRAQQSITSNPAKEFVLVETTIQQQEKTIIDDEKKGSKIDLTRGFICGDSLIDLRDNQSYATVQIGDQCWMAENLNIGERIDASTQMTNNETLEKYCYENATENCDNYGGLYQWNEMMQYTTVQGSEGICPNGWKLPTDNEWKILEGTVDSQYPVGDPEWDNWSWRGSDVGGHLKEIGTNHWSAPNVGATNSSGFTAVAGGYAAGDSFSYLGQFGMYWTSTQLTDDNSIMRGIYYALTSNMRNDYGKALAIGVRCIQGSEVINEPPATPSDPNPANGSIGNPIESALSWVCTDPDGDPLTYDVYFGTQADPPLVSEGISENTYDPGVLDYYTQYFWKIVAHDDHANSTEGPIWSFTSTELFFMVTFEIVDEAANPLQNAVITLNDVVNPPNNYMFDEVPAGTFNYMVELSNYITSYGQVTVVDQNMDVMVVMTELVVISDFPWVEDFADGQLPEGWRNEILTGSFSWEFALDPFPHTLIHNIGRPAVNARLITPLLDASDIGQVTLGINQRFWIEPMGGTAQILISNDGQNWDVIGEYISSIGTGDDFQYTEFNISEFAAGQQVFICLNADFPDTDATYEVVWEVESMSVFQPHYTVTFEVENENGIALSDAIITLGDFSNPAGNYIFEDIIAGTYNYNVKL
nr:fibrobacter succinogenes major paralogous domain-containing protein [Bacteroidota bacterium]